MTCSSPKSRWWLGNDPIATAVYNGLSLNFPRAEAFFISSVKKYAGQVPDGLAGEVRSFIIQESMHTREHAKLNRRIVAAGYNIGNIEIRMNSVLAQTRQMPDSAKLASTMILEHITAIGSRQLLSDHTHLAGAHPKVNDLWQWHAVEEIEHKAVAYDVWIHATKDWSPWERWKTRCMLMLVVTAGFCKQRWPLRGITTVSETEIGGSEVRLHWIVMREPSSGRPQKIGIWQHWHLTS